jgi:hypothetical protein
MSSQDNSVTIIDKALSIIDNLDPLEEKKSPVVAAILGFFCGGFGLGIYFRSLKDFIVLLAIWIVIALVAIPTYETLDILGCIFSCFYGYRRVMTSNAKRDALNASIIDAHVISSQVPGTPPPIAPLGFPTKTPLPLSASIPAQTPPPLPKTVEQRLKSLSDLRDRNVITQAEFEAKRQQILSEM